MGHGAASAPSSVFTFAGRLHLLGHGERDEQNVNAPSAAVRRSQPALRAEPTESGVRHNRGCPTAPLQQEPTDGHRKQQRSPGSRLQFGARPPALPWPPGAISSATPIWGAIATTKGLGGATGDGGRWGTGGDEERGAMRNGRR